MNDRLEEGSDILFDARAKKGESVRANDSSSVEEGACLLRVRDRMPRGTRAIHSLNVPTVCSS